MSHMGRIVFSLFVLLSMEVAFGDEIRMGDSFPALTFEDTLSSEDRQYLGLPESGPFSLREVAAEVIVVEFLNKYCMSCQRQAPIFNRVYEALEDDPQLAGRAKMLGVGVGNSLLQVRNFRKEKAIPFPIVPDPKFAAYDSVGEPKTPFTVLVRRDSERGAVVLSTHRGVIFSDAEFLQEIRAALQYNLDLIEIRPESEVPRPKEPPKITMSEQTLEDLVRRSMTSSGAEISDLKKATLSGGRIVYVGTVRVGDREERRFAPIVSLHTLCDVCHDIHFLYVFDTEGKIVNFAPVLLAKYGNEPWDEDDVELTKSRMVGRSLLGRFAFDPEVDAVSSATITSMLIFRSLGRGEELLEELRSQTTYMER